MQVLVTGATGLIGNAIAKSLVARGDQVRVLARSPEKAEALLSGVTLFKGDVTEPASLSASLKGVEQLFHAAGMPEQWQPDEAAFDRVNRVGTRHVLEAALDARVRRAVYTSTMDVFAAPPGGTLVETRVDEQPKPTRYERSKQAAEQEAEQVARKGLSVVFVNPSAVFGPSPVHIALNSFFVQLMQRKMPLLPPGGMSVVYVDGVANAHLAAADRGRPGERYLLADGYVSNVELAQHIARAAGLLKVPKSAPAWLLRAIAYGSAPLARRFGFQPLVAPGQLSFLLWQARVDATKAERELGFRPLPIEEGVRRTVEFLRREGVA
jgi:dihydroflavonol-4-reductase